MWDAIIHGKLNEPSKKINMTSVADPRKVFVVHGRNQKARDALFEFLRALGLQPIEWAQAVKLTEKASPYIGEILEAAFSNAQAVVALLTGDDEVKLRNEFFLPNDQDYEQQIWPQARPNVLFEAGLAFGIHPDRTILVELGELKPFSDAAGRHTIKMDNSSEKRNQLVERLRTAGCHVDTTGTDWLNVANFDEAIIPFEKKIGEEIKYNLSEEQKKILSFLGRCEENDDYHPNDKTIAENIHLPLAGC